MCPPFVLRQFCGRICGSVSDPDSLNPDPYIIWIRIQIFCSIRIQIQVFRWIRIWVFCWIRIRIQTKIFLWNLLTIYSWKFLKYRHVFLKPYKWRSGSSNIKFLIFFLSLFGLRDPLTRWIWIQSGSGTLICGTYQFCGSVISVEYEARTIPNHIFSRGGVLWNVDPKQLWSWN